MNPKKIAFIGLFASLAILMGYIEVLIPIPLLIPGMKLGLANIIPVIVLYLWDAKTAVCISLIRVVLSGLMFSGVAALLYSLSGAVFSLAAMILIKKYAKSDIVFVSIVGGISHNIGQIIIATLVVKTLKLLYYLPFLVVFGIITGCLIGLVAKNSLNYLSKVNL